jgi:hypothetical protein
MSGEQCGMLRFQLASHCQVFEDDDQGWVDVEPRATDAAFVTPLAGDRAGRRLRSEQALEVGSVLRGGPKVLQGLGERRAAPSREVERSELRAGSDPDSRIIEPSLPGEDMVRRIGERVFVPADAMPDALQCAPRTNARANGAMSAISAGVSASRSTAAGARSSSDEFAPKNHPCASRSP